MNNTVLSYILLMIIAAVSFLSIFFFMKGMKKDNKKIETSNNVNNTAIDQNDQDGFFTKKYKLLLLEFNKGKLSKGSFYFLGMIGLASFFLIFSLSGFKMLFISFLVMAAIIVIPQILISSRKNKFNNKFNEELVDTLEILSNAMKAGNSFGQALEVASNEVGEPIASELKEIVKKNKMGFSFSELLNLFMTKFPEMHELRLSITAMNVSLEIGGNLTVILSKISQTMKDRTKIKKKIGAMTAQGMLSAFVAGGAPWVMMGIMYLVQPGMMNIMFESMIGNVVMIIVLFLDAIGIYFIRKISSVEV